MPVTRAQMFERRLDGTLDGQICKHEAIIQAHFFLFPFFLKEQKSLAWAGLARVELRNDTHGKI